MGCLFRFDKVKGVIINPDAVQLTEHIKLLDEKGQLFLIYLLDYESIYAQHPYVVRMRFALAKVYGHSPVDVTTELFKEAMFEYKILQYDSDRETERVYTDKIEMVQRELLDAKASKAIKEARQTIKDLSEDRAEIRMLIDKKDADVRLRGEGEALSLIEKYQIGKEKRKQEDKISQQQEMNNKKL